jgi:hypothetical protein
MFSNLEVIYIDIDWQALLSMHRHRSIRCPIFSCSRETRDGGKNSNADVTLNMWAGAELGGCIA